MMSGTMGPRMLVRSDITKKVRNTRATICRFLVIGSSALLGRQSPRGHHEPFLKPLLSRGGRDFGTAKPVVPDPGCANEIRVLPERRQHQFGLFPGDEAAALADHRADSVEKKIGALHK